MGETESQTQNLGLTVVHIPTKEDKKIIIDKIQILIFTNDNLEIFR